MKHIFKVSKIVLKKLVNTLFLAQMAGNWTGDLSINDPILDSQIHEFLSWNLKEIIIKFRHLRDVNRTVPNQNQKNRYICDNYFLGLKPDCKLITNEMKKMKLKLRFSQARKKYTKTQTKTQYSRILFLR